MKNELQRIMELQPLWDHRKTPEMDERGQLIRRSGPDWLRSFGAELAAAMGVESADLFVEGSDGAGQKTEVPWFRFASRSRSPSATQNWYCVYLFDTKGSSAYLSLGHGSTIWNGVDFVPRPETELRKLCDWGRKRVASVATRRSDLLNTLTLDSRRSKLGPAYESGTALCLRYDQSAIPEDDQLRDDALFFAHMLRVVYEASDVLPPPIGPPVEVVEALEVADRLAGKAPERKGGQGFRLSSEQRRAVELQAMKLAREYLESNGWELEDTSAEKPYDFYCLSSAGELYVEVKGTTSSGESIVLTGNEVDHQRRVYPANGLVIVRDIQLGGPNLEQATGGALAFICPWTIEEDRLRVVNYVYSLDNFE